MHNIYCITSVLIKQVEMWPSWYCVGLKYLWDYGTNCNDGITRVIGNLRVPTGHPRTSCFKPRGSLGLSPLRSDGSCDGQAGEAGPVEHILAEAKSLKIKGQGAVRLPPQWATTEATRQGARGPNKELLSWQFTKRKQSLKQLWPEAQSGKRQPAKEASIEKRKDAYSMLQSWSCRRGRCRSWWRCRWMRTRIANHRSMWQRLGILGLSLGSEVK